LVEDLRNCRCFFEQIASSLRRPKRKNLQMRLPSLVSALALSAALCACATAPTPQGAHPAPSASAQRLVPTQLPRTARPLHYRIAMAPDPANLRYGAAVTIDIEVLEPTDEITLDAADIEFGAVRLLRGRASPVAARVETSAEAQTATFHFPDRLEPGRYSLMIDYSGHIYTQASGLFALDYDSPDGRKRALFTQFQAPDARRFVPSWDEPNFRTPWDLQVTVPAGQTAVGNMPEAGRERRPDGSEVVTFQTTPPMSSYLLFLGVGEFDRITATSAGTELGIVTRRGSAEQGRFALQESVRVMPWFTDYFGMPYPLPKLDNIAGPGSSQQFAAMENWGAIFSFEPYLLIDPAITTEAERQFTY
jgi:aminopeptidase N